MAFLDDKRRVERRGPNQSPDCVKTRIEQKGNALKSRIKRFNFGRGRFDGVFCTILEPFSSYHTASRSSQPLAVVINCFDLMKEFPVFATLALPSGGSAPSR
jgi:hypothetical protein